MLAWWSGKRVAMTDMPQMIALYNGMGGGAAAAIAAVELYTLAMADPARRDARSASSLSLAVIGGIIGAVSFRGIADRLRQAAGADQALIRFGGQQVREPACCSAVTLVLGAWVVLQRQRQPDGA